MELTKRALAIVMAGIMFCGCTDEADGPTPIEREPYTPLELTAEETETRAHVLDFASDLFEKICDKWDESSQANGVVSPISMAMCMASLANGCEGEARREILDAMGGMESLDNLNGYLGRVQKEMPGVSVRPYVKLANSMWVNRSVDVNTDYLNVMKDIYETESYEWEYVDSDLESRINRWCYENTEGLIDRYPIRSMGNILYLNSIYFDGKWQEKFDKSKTSKRDFHNIDGSVRKVDMMRGYQWVAYNADENMVYVEMHYEGGFNMLIFMPVEGKNLSDLKLSLNDCWMPEKAGMVDLMMPRFSLEGEEGFTDVMRKLGINKVFDSDRELTNVSDSPLALGDLMQKVMIDVDEDGSTVVAVSGGTMDGAAPPVEMPNQIIVDRPFIFMISEWSTRTPIAIGRVTKF